MRAVGRFAIVGVLGVAGALGLACRHEPAPVADGHALAGDGDDDGHGDGVEDGHGDPPALAEPRLPVDGDDFPPSLTERGEGPEPVVGRDLLDADTCGACHEQIVAQWRTSAHAFASFNNPIYRASIARFRATDNPDAAEQSQFCGGCHDPALLVDGLMAQPSIAAADARAHVGVACRNCHGVESSRPDGNGSYVLASRAISIPTEGDEASVQAHRDAMQGEPRQQCGSCHRAFVGVETGHPHHLGGTDELGPWRDSSYGGSRLRLDTPVDERDCVDCHMPDDDGDPSLTEPAADDDGRFRSHRFIGGHTWLAAMRHDDETLARVQSFLTGIASIDVAAVELEGARHLLGAELDAAQLREGGRAVFDLVVRNRAVGHRFPGGTRDAQDTWLALRIFDADGRELASLDERSGEVHRLRAGVVDGEGQLISAREVERLRAVAFDHTIAPRDAIVVRYAVELPAGHEGVRVEARLLHRSRTLALARETCAAAEDGDGRAFIVASEALLGVALDPCVDPPVTEVARATLGLGDLAAGVDDPERPDHERLWELGLALSHHVQERLPEAREALDAALSASDVDDGATRARITAALGAVAARQGRVDEALALADAVEQLAPGHPYPHLLRGRALAKVWRWEQAVPHLQRALAASPDSPRLYAELALAHGSAGQPREALAVAAAGLELRPRDEALLRAQALALRSLEDPRAEAALDAYFAHRKPDDQPHLGAACGARDPVCARERVPVHVHEF